VLWISINVNAAIGRSISSQFKIAISTGHFPCYAWYSNCHKCMYYSLISKAAIILWVKFGIFKIIYIILYFWVTSNRNLSNSSNDFTVVR
jgi:hypothetical protein